MSIEKNGNGKLVALLSAVYFVSYFTRKDFAAVMVGMLSSGVITGEQGGFIGMGLFAMYGTGQLVSGYLGDKLKPAHLLIGGLSLTVVCNAIMPLVPNGWGMIPVWAMNGFAQAMLWPPILKLLAENLSGEAFVRGNLVVTSAAHVATIILYLYVPVCIEIFSWRTVFISAASLAALVMLIFAFAMSRILRSDSENAGTGATVSVKSEEKEKSKLGAIVTASSLVPILFAIITMGYLRDGIESWLPTLYSESFGKSASESVLVSVILPIFSIASIMLVTAIHKKPIFNNEVRGGIVTFGISAVASGLTAVFMTLEGAAFSMLCLVLAALSCAAMHGCNFLYISCIPGRFKSTGRVSTVGGICNAFVYIGAAISMYAMAFVSERLGWVANTVIWAGVSALGAILSICAYKKFTAYISNNK